MGTENQGSREEKPSAQQQKSALGNQFARSGHGRRGAELWGYADAPNPAARFQALPLL